MLYVEGSNKRVGLALKHNQYTHMYLYGPMDSYPSLGLIYVRLGALVRQI